MARYNTILFVKVCLCLALAQAGYAQLDVQWTFGNNGDVDYVLESFDPADADLGPIGAADPTLNVIIGQRYQVTVTNYIEHPLEILAKAGDPSNDMVLLSMMTEGSLQNDPDVNWIYDGMGTATFTLTSALASAMATEGQQPGYRCGTHVVTMRGNFNVLTGALDDPIPEPITKGDITVELEVVADGMASPLDMADPGDGTNRLFIVDQDGRVFIIQNGKKLDKLFLDVRDSIVSPLGIRGTHDVNDFDERGLLGLALHPGFANPESPGYQTLYTYTSEPDTGSFDFTTDPAPETVNHQSVIAEWLVDVNDPNLVDVTTRRELMRIDQPQFNHNAGMLVFGPDNYLYISLGDGGRANDTGDGHGKNGNGQNIETVHGSVLRIDPLLPMLTPDNGNAVSMNGQYRIPSDNPFVGVDGVDEIFAYGLRNPFRFSYDAEQDVFIVADVGQNFIEEVDIMFQGGNYGWNLKEGSFVFDPTDGSVSLPNGDLPEGLIDPIAEYDHDEGIAVVGGYVYRGKTVFELQGMYVFGDYTRSGDAPDGRLFYLDMENENSEIQELVIGMEDRPLGLYVKGFGQDKDGEIYVLASPYTGPYGSEGMVLKIVTPPQCSLTVSSTNGGSVTTPGEGEFSFNCGTTVDIQAAPDDLYYFLKWTGSAVDAGKVADPESANTTVLMDDDYTLEANFASVCFDLSTSSSSGGMVTAPGEGEFTICGNFLIPLEAVADPHYHFVNWTGSAVAADAVVNDESPITSIFVLGNYNVKANFEIDTHILTISSTEGGSVTTPGEGMFEYDFGTEVSIVATPDEHYKFVGWTGSAVDAGKVADPGSASTTVSVEGDYTLVANFEIDTHILTICSTNGGSVTTPGEGMFEYNHGTVVDLVATPDECYRFKYWLGPVEDPCSASTTVTITEDITVTAVFVKKGCPPKPCPEPDPKLE